MASTGCYAGSNKPHTDTLTRDGRSPAIFYTDHNRLLLRLLAAELPPAPPARSHLTTMDQHVNDYITAPAHNRD